MKTLIALILILVTSTTFAGNFSTQSPCINNEEVIVRKQLDSSQLGQIIGEDLQFEVSKVAIDFLAKVENMSLSEAQRKLIESSKKQTHFLFSVLQCKNSDFISVAVASKFVNLNKVQMDMLREVLPKDAIIQHAPGSAFNDNPTFLNNKGQLSMSSFVAQFLIVQTGSDKVQLSETDSRETVLIIKEGQKEIEFNVSKDILTIL